MSKEWLCKQFNWLKSFLSDPQLPDNENQKGSMKRVTTLVLVVIFTLYYKSVTNVYIERMSKISDEKFVDLLKDHSFSPPDIPEVWALLLAGILAINVADYFVKKRSNITDEEGKRLNNLAFRVEDVNSKIIDLSSKIK